MAGVFVDESMNEAALFFFIIRWSLLVFYIRSRCVTQQKNTDEVYKARGSRGLVTDIRSSRCQGTGPLKANAPQEPAPLPAVKLEEHKRSFNGRSFAPSDATFH